ncbi:hypothetical protein ASE12_04345 [Aeromicrobium sp. Root236]|nr:hypothetical protein ASE12_04345 [Aeromicrobium sp. Root236]
MFIDDEYDPLRIASSIARHGYFESEPLIATKASDDEYVVLEGNRRLTALLGLSDDSLRAQFVRQNSGWKSLGGVRLPAEFPVIVVDDPASVVPLLGFRHISGITPWDPYQQAGYIARLVDEGRPLVEVAELVGRELTEVRAMYRDFEILRQAHEEFGLNIARARDNFGVFNAAMGRVPIRAFIAAPAPREVDPEYWPLPSDHKPQMSRLLGYIFGDAKGENRVVRDSRQLKQLADVLSDATATVVLDQTRSLEDAHAATVDARSQLIAAVAAAGRNLAKANALGPTSIDASTRRELQTLIARANALLGLSDEGAEE